MFKNFVIKTTLFYVLIYDYNFFMSTLQVSINLNIPLNKL